MNRWFSSPRRTVRPDHCCLNLERMEDRLTPAGFDVRMLAFEGLAGNASVTVKYAIDASPAPAFKIDFFESVDGLFNAGDALLRSVSITAAADLTVGVHTKTFTVGSATAQLPLPGVAPVNAPTYLLAVADSANIVAESDANPFNEDNAAVFQGVYHVVGGAVVVHTGEGNDLVSLVPRNAVQHILDVNGKRFVYANSDVSAVCVYLHGGLDQLRAATANEIVQAWGGAGNDALFGGNRNDQFAAGDGNDRVFAGAGRNRVYGDAGSDTLYGGASADYLVGGLGSDALFGLAGSDILYAESGNDILRGGDGADYLVGGLGSDTLFGEAGNDTLLTSIGRDFLYPGAGADRLVWTKLQQAALSGTVSVRLAASLSLEGSISGATGRLSAVVSANGSLTSSGTLVGSFSANGSGGGSGFGFNATFSGSASGGVNGPLANARVSGSATGTYRVTFLGASVASGTDNGSFTGTVNLAYDRITATLAGEEYNTAGFGEYSYLVTQAS
jgi:Ca2+-binding RTX toxin-like protein